MEYKLYIIVDGNPVDGFTFCGPFNTHHDAYVYAEVNYKHISWWWIAKMNPVVMEN